MVHEYWQTVVCEQNSELVLWATNASEPTLMLTCHACAVCIVLWWSRSRVKVYFILLLVLRCMSVQVLIITKVALGRRYFFVDVVRLKLFKNFNRFFSLVLKWIQLSQVSSERNRRPSYAHRYSCTATDFRPTCDNASDMSDLVVLGGVASKYVVCW